MAEPGGEFSPVSVALRDGRSVTLRAICPEDAPAVQAAFAGLSGQARYNRFMAPLNHLSPRMLERAVRPRAERELALVAIAGESEIVGGARYVRTADADCCEFAVTIVDAWQGAGLASRMLRELIREARACGLKRMEGFVLASNQRMLGLARRLGFAVMESEDGPGVQRVQLDLQRATE